MRTKTLSVTHPLAKELFGKPSDPDSGYPNFSITGSIAGMKRLYYGRDAKLVRCGQFIYNVTHGGEHIYEAAH